MPRILSLSSLVSISGQRLVQDALTEMTKKKRRTLMVAATAGIVLATAHSQGLNPPEVVVFGTKFNPSQYELLLHYWGYIVLYLIVAFITYAILDILACLHKIIPTVMEAEIAEANLKKAERKRLDELHAEFTAGKQNFTPVIAEAIASEERNDIHEKLSTLSALWSYYITLFRVPVIDFLFPAILGIYAFWFLVIK